MTKRIAIFSLAALLSTSCQDGTDPVGTLPELTPQGEIVDAVHNAGNEHFFFLPPMVVDPITSGTFDGSLEPVVEICQLSLCGTSTVATFTTTTGPGSETVRVNTVEEHYIVNWNTSDGVLGETYRIQVSVSGTELGHADVILLSGGSMKNAKTQDPIPLKDGRTLAIKFRIEDGALGPFCIAPPSGLVSWWDGDGNANDIQDGNDGMLVNGATFATGFVTSGNGQAFRLDGIDDHVLVATNGINACCSNQGTVDAWVLHTDVSTAGEPFNQGHMVFGTRTNPGERLYLSFIAGGTATTVGTYFIGLGNQFINTAVPAQPIGEWHHQALAWDSGNWRWYLDGVERASGTYTGAPNVQLKICIGCAVREDTPVRLFFNGLIDEVEIFNRALSTSEIQDIFNAGSDGKCKP